MIGYFDTSALVKLIIDEDGHTVAAALWAASRRIVCGRLGYPEARAALAAAARLGRLDPAGLFAAKTQFERRWARVRVVELDAALARRAGDLAERQALRGYDAVHLASALLAGERTELVLVCWDGRLRSAAAAEGLRLAPAQVA